MEPSNDQKIYYACERVRIFCFMRAGKPIMKSKDDEKIGDFLGAKRVTDSLCKGSLISSIIENHKWEELFANEDWLSVLEMAQNLNSLEAGTISKELETIAMFFPEETKGYIIVDILS